MLLGRPRRAVLALLLGALCGAPIGAVAAPRPSGGYDAGLSTPQEDSYYPGKGDPGIDALHYGLDLTWHRSTRTLTGVADIRLRATETADSFQLDLGDSLRVRTVAVDGRRVTSTHRDRVLRVQAPVVADTRYDVRVVYSGTPRPIHAPTTRGDFDKIGMRVTSDGQLWTQQEPFGALTWYPVNDQPSDKALYDVQVAVPRDWVGVSNGRLTETRRTKQRTITRFRLRDPAASYLMTLAVGPYTRHRSKGPHGLPLNFWLPRGQVKDYLPTLRHVGKDLRWLESRLGRYPFESAGVVMVPGAASAMETQTLITFGQQSWWDPWEARATMVHELAHQWYGDTVTPRDWRDLWLNEGMAMYLQARWSASHGTTRWSYWTETFKYSNVVDRRRQGGPGAYDRRQFATSCVYLCTALMYDRLRLKVGDRSFWKIVRTWPQTHRNQNADRAGFESLAEAVSGRNLTSFFDTWLNSPVWPPD